MKIQQNILVLAASILSLTASAASAAVMTFNHSGIGSGTLNGVPFSNKKFTITATGDAPVNFPGGRAIQHDSASITMEELGTFNFLSLTRTFVNNDVAIVGFSRSENNGTDGSDLFNGPVSPVFAAWNLQSNIAMVSGVGRLIQWGSGMTTSGGLLFFNTDEATTASFSASVVPEPTSAVLTLAGASVLLLKRRRRL